MIIPNENYIKYLISEMFRNIVDGLLRIYAVAEHETPAQIAQIHKHRRNLYDLQEFFPEHQDYILNRLCKIWNETIVDLCLESESFVKLKSLIDCPWGCEVILSSWIPHWTVVQKVLGYPIALESLFSADEVQLRAIIEDEPNHAQAFCNLGVLYLNSGQSESAQKLFEHSLEICPNSPDTLLNYSVLLSNAGDIKTAEELLHRAITINPNYVVALSNLGYILSEQERFEEAEQVLRQALDIDPDYLVALLNITVPLHNQGAFQESEKMLRHLLSIEPTHIDAALNLFVCLLNQKRETEAEKILLQLISDQPQCTEAMSKLGIYLYQHDRFDEAELWLKKAHHTSKDSAQSTFDLSTFMLLRGDYLEGFSLYESRFMAPSNNNPLRFPHHDAWQGANLDGKSILIHAEQGFGDMLQCARYLPLIQERGGRVILETRSELFRLFEQSQLADQIFVEGDPIPEFDTYIPFMSLPHAFATEVHNIPRKTPYLRVDASLERHWQQRLSGISGFRVGLVWAGNPQHRNDEARSIPLHMLSPMSSLSGVQLISLQKGSGEKQLSDSPFPMHNFSDSIEDFADTAAILRHLDLLVCVDTSIAHLAGALNIPTCLLLAKSPDWRWLLDRTDSPWYPSLKLFRQKQANSWDDLIDELTAHISLLITHKCK